MLIPRGLLAADLTRKPAEEVDVLVVGSGVAGLSAALAVPAGRTVLLATKDRLGHSPPRHPQGGVAGGLGKRAVAPRGRGRTRLPSTWPTPWPPGPGSAIRSRSSFWPRRVPRPS